MKKIIVLTIILFISISGIKAAINSDTLYVADHDSLFRNFKRELIQIPNSIAAVDFKNISEAVEVMPNPIKNMLFIKINDGLMGKMQIRLIDWQGEVSKSFEIDKIESVSNQMIKMNDVPKGAYILQIRQDNYCAYKKIIKK